MKLRLINWEFFKLSNLFLQGAGSLELLNLIEVEDEEEKLG